jgi:hypothetical protein
MASVTITSRPTKTLLGSSTIEFLGQNVSVGEVSVHAEKINKFNVGVTKLNEAEEASSLGLFENITRFFRTRDSTDIHAYQT